MPENSKIAQGSFSEFMWYHDYFDLLISSITAVLRMTQKATRLISGIMISILHY